VGCERAFIGLHRPSLFNEWLDNSHEPMSDVQQVLRCRENAGEFIDLRFPAQTMMATCPFDRWQGHDAAMSLPNALMSSVILGSVRGGAIKLPWPVDQTLPGTEAVRNDREIERHLQSGVPTPHNVRRSSGHPCARGP